MVGNRIKQIREENSLTQQQFAKKIGTSKGYVSEIERNIRTPGTEILLSIKRFFGTNIDWILTGEETEENQSKNGSHAVFDKNPELIEIFEMTKEIINSKTGYANLLTANVKSFYQAIVSELRLKDIEERLSRIEEGKIAIIPDRRKAERRRSIKDNNIPGGTDRRSGQDRRKVAGGDH